MDDRVPERDLSRLAVPRWGRLVKTDNRYEPYRLVDADGATVAPRFECQHRGDAGALVIVPRIDGAPLTELIDGFEIAAGMKPAGDAYGGLIPEFFRFGPMLDHFLGRSTNAMGPKTPVLGCECGEWGCWPLMVRITATAGLVTWDAFEQPHRTTRDYTAFGPFHFDRHQYDDALRALSATISSDNR